MNKTINSNLENYYSQELLKSAGEKNPPRLLFEAVKMVLMDKSKNQQTELIQKLITKKNITKKALLLESKPLFLKSHYVLISNCGFSVDVATNTDELIAKENIEYHAIFTCIRQKHLNAWVGARFLKDKHKSNKPKIFLILKKDEEVEFRDYLIKQGADEILEIPLRFTALKKKLNT